MKKIILTLLSFFSFVIALAQTGEKPVFVDNVLQVQYVIPFEKKTSTEIYNGIKTFIGEWNSEAKNTEIDKLAIKRKIEIENSNQNDGVISFSGKYNLGVKSSLMSVYRVDANYSCNFKIKDERALITLKIPSLFYLYQAYGNFYHDYPINECYPEVTTKKELYNDKKMLKTFGALLPEKIKELINEIIKAVNKDSSEIDF